MRIRDEQSCLLARVRRSPSRLYTIRLDIARPMCLTARKADEAWRWHQRFGHISFQALHKLQSGNMARGLPHIDHVDQLCDSCLAGKQRRSLFPAQARRRAGGVLELVHGDICGPITPMTPSGNHYFLLLVDDMSRYMWLCLLASKDQAPTAIRRFKAAAELESGHKLKVLRTDRGGEFTSVEFGAYCAEEGVQRQLTAPYSPQQNGVVER
jgi:transposase InsO family protein